MRRAPECPSLSQRRVQRDRVRAAILALVAVDGPVLAFHDLAVDLGASPARAYEVEIEAHGPGAPHRARRHLDAPAVPLDSHAHGATRLALVLSIADSHAKPTRVELSRRGAEWLVTRVTHA